MEILSPNHRLVALYIYIYIKLKKNKGLNSNLIIFKKLFKILVPFVYNFFLNKFDPIFEKKLMATWVTRWNQYNMYCSENEGRQTPNLVITDNTHSLLLSLLQFNSFFLISIYVIILYLLAHNNTLSRVFQSSSFIRSLAFSEGSRVYLSSIQQRYFFVYLFFIFLIYFLNLVLIF